MFTILSVVLISIFAILNYFDVILTVKIIKAGGSEKMPLSRWFIAKWGLERGLALEKLLLVAGAATACSITSLTLPRVTAVTLIVLDIIYAWAVHHNYLETKKS